MPPKEEIELIMAIELFEDAFKVLKKAETKLAKAVAPFVKKCNTIQDMLNLIDQMPKGYAGTGFMFEWVEQKAVEDSNKQTK